MTTVDGAPVDLPESRDVPSTQIGGVGIVDVMLLAFVVALCTAHGFGIFLFESFTLRMALLLVAGVPGLLALAKLARRGDRPSWAASALVVWTLVAVLFSGAPLLALKGTIGRELTGVTFVLGLGVWAIGRSASRRSVELMPAALLIGLGVNGLVGLTQVVFGIESGPFSMQFSRATGLTSSPVYFGALMAAGAGLAAGNVRWRLERRVALTVAFAAATNLSGSRVAVAAGLVAVAGALLLTSDENAWRARIAPPVGYLVGVAVTSLSWFGGGAEVRTSTERLSGVGGGGRIDAWSYGFDAIADRPVFGWGLGRFRAATQERFTPDFVRVAAFDDLRQAWFDAHNLFINLAVGIGVVGCLLAVAWLVYALRSIHGPLVLPLVALGAVLMLQPAGLAIVPLAMLLLGCAGDRDRPAELDRPSRATSAALLVGVLFAAWLVVGDLRLNRAVERSNAATVESAASWFPNDAVVADVVAQSYFLESSTDTTARAEALEWSRRAIDAEPDRPYLRTAYAGRLAAYERYEEALAELDAALALEPWHLDSWVLTFVIADLTDDSALKEAAVVSLCELEQPLDDC